MNKEMVSVIIPTYNREQVIGRSITSVLSQTYPYFELLIVDDGSTDRTRQVVKQIQDERIRYIRLEQNGGVSHARNVGIQEAKYDYIAFQDSDDEWLPEKLELQMDKMLNSSEEWGAVYCRMDYISKKTGERHIFPPLKWKKEYIEGTIFNGLLLKNLIGTPTVLVRKECIEQVGAFKEALTCLVDWEWVLRIAKEYPIGLVDQDLLKIHISEGSVSTNLAGKVIARCYMVSKYRKEMKMLDLLDAVEEEVLKLAKNIGIYEETRELLSRNIEL